MTTARTATADAPPVPAEGGSAPPPWSQVWQLPALLLGLGLLVLGVWLSLPNRTPPDYAGVLNEAAAYLTARNGDDARRRLEGLGAIIGDAPDPQRARFEQYRGDLTALELEQMPLDPATRPGRQKREAMLTRYEAAEALGGKEHELPVAVQTRWAQALVELGREPEALARVDHLPADPVARRLGVLRSLIERRLAQPQAVANPQGGAKDARITPLIQRYEEELGRERDGGRQRAGRAWVAWVEGRLRLDAGDVEGAVDLLLRRTARLLAEGLENPDHADDPADIAPLHLLLAQGYARMGRPEESERYYLLAQAGLPDQDPRQAQVLVGLARVALAGRGDERSLEAAHAMFAQAARDYPTSDAALDALIGQADVEAQWRQMDQARERFRLAEEMLQHRPADDPRRQELIDVMRAHLHRCSEDGAYDEALDVLGQLMPMYGERVPTTLIEQLAVAQERVAADRQERAMEVDRAGRPVLSPDARRLAFQEAAAHYGRAARAYLRHADAVTVSDNAAHGRSLWAAAANFDRAQRWPEAVDAYARFIRERQGDPDAVKALSNLGRALLADGQNAAALERFDELLAQAPSSKWAVDCLVPRAHAMLAVGDTGGAERALLFVVTDHPALDPQSEAYRDATVALGRLRHRLAADDPDRWPDAIATLTEAVERWGESDDGPTLRFLLADSYRQSVPAVREQVARAQSHAQQLALGAEADRRLMRAQGLYDQVVTQLEGRTASEMSPLERVYQRHAYFYRADCAFDRQAYELAIELYTEAAQRWEDHPDCLAALIQIVNAYHTLGRERDAQLANRRALWKYEQIPAEAFDDPTLQLPLERERWADWLAWMQQQQPFERAAAVP